MKTKTPGSLWDFFGANREAILAWNHAALEGALTLAYNILRMSFVLGVLTLTLAAVAQGLELWAAKVWIGVISVVLYFAAWIPLIRMRRAWHAAGLVFEADMLQHLWKSIKEGQIKVEWGRVTVADGTRLRIGALAKVCDILLIAINVQINLVWFIVVMPFWHYPLATALLALAGITWLAAHRKIDFMWFEWFGSFAGDFCFVGSGVYMIADFMDHPFPLALGFFAGTAVLFATNPAWWRGLPRPIKLVGSLAVVVILFAPYVAFLRRIQNTVFSWDNAQNALANVPFSIDWQAPSTLVIAGILVLVLTGRRSQ